MKICKHTTEKGIIIPWHSGKLDDCLHDCEENHRVAFNQLYCDTCGWEETKEKLRRMGLPV